MKKNNKKGFVLAESIVVGVFLLGLLSILILNVIPLMGDYERVAKYDNLDRKYDINLIRKMLLESNQVEKDKGESGVLGQYQITYGSVVGYLGYSNTDTLCEELDTYSNYCKALFSSLNVKTVILSIYNITKLKEASLNGSIEVSRGLKEYIKYLPSDAMISTNYAKFKNYKKLIVEFNDNTYACIEVPYE